MVRYTTFTRFWGFGMKVTITLPIAMAIPAKEVTIPRTAVPPLGLGMTSPGKAASKAEETRLTPDIKRMRVKIIGVFRRKTMPSFASVRKLSLLFLPVSGSRVNAASATNAMKKLHKSTPITTSSPARP